MADDLILHHYDASPFSEKVRVVLGMKGRGVALGGDSHHHAQARFFAPHRRLSAHPRLCRSARTSIATPR